MPEEEIHAILKKRGARTPDAMQSILQHQENLDFVGDILEPDDHTMLKDHVKSTKLRKSKAPKDKPEDPGPGVGKDGGAVGQKWEVRPFPTEPHWSLANAKEFLPPKSGCTLTKDEKRFFEMELVLPSRLPAKTHYEELGTPDRSECTGVLRVCSVHRVEVAHRVHRRAVPLRVDICQGMTSYSSYRSTSSKHAVTNNRLRWASYTQHHAYIISLSLNSSCRLLWSEPGLYKARPCLDGRLSGPLCHANRETCAERLPSQERPMSLVLWLAVAVVVWMMVLLWVAVVVVVWWLAAACRSSGCGVVGGSVAVDGSGVMDDASGVMDGSGVAEGIVIPCSGAAAQSSMAAVAEVSAYA